MKRRDFIALAGAAAAFPRWALAQQAATKRLGFLFSLAGDDPQTPRYLTELRAGLAKQGWAEGKNLVIDYRYSAGQGALSQAYSKELLDLKPDVVLAIARPNLAEVARLTQKTPIIFALSDPVTDGLVTNVARPEGNITGFINTDTALGGKAVDMIREIVPGAKTVAMLTNPAENATAPGGFTPLFASFQTAAARAGIKAELLAVNKPEEFAPVIAALAKEESPALWVPTGTFLTNNRTTIIAEVARNRLPTVYGQTLYVDAGAMVTYYVDSFPLTRAAADYAGQVLNGTKVADLPVQYPTTLTLAVNLKTAASLGIAIPNSILIRADQVIQ